MSDVFFRELEIPRPNYNLGVGSGQHGAQTGTMLKGLEDIFLAERPSATVVFGDTNSTLAGALAAAKLQIPVIHIEAGLRSFNRKMPEEINRVMTDHVASLLLCPTPTAVKNLEREGITENVHHVGDVMHDIFQCTVEMAAQKSKILQSLRLSSGNYLLATVHRAENTDSETHLENILSAFAEIASKSIPIVFAAHPRTQKAIVARHSLEKSHVHIIEPVSYFDMIQLEKNARLIFTDSGGIQKEAWWLRVPCIILREETEWVEMMENGNNLLAGTSQEKIVETYRFLSVRRPQFAAFSTELPNATQRHLTKILEMGRA
jgi:UDP-N-acetylglucosamine 2-epimerase